MESTKAGTNRVPLSIIAAQITGWLWIGALSWLWIGPLIMTQSGHDRVEVYSNFWALGYMLPVFQSAPGRGLHAIELCLLCECLFASALVMIFARQNLGRIIANLSVTLILGLTIAPIVAAIAHIFAGLHDQEGMNLIGFLLQNLIIFVINFTLWFFIIFVPLFLVLLALNSSSSRKWLKASLTVPPVPPQG